VRTTSDLRRAADAAGLTVDQVELVPMPGAPGQTTIAARMSFEDPWAAARLLQELADQDARDPVVRAWALAILDETARTLGEDASGSTLSPELWDAYAEALHANVQTQIRFVHEPGEVFQSARVTMSSRAGDCDCHARLLYALSWAGGIPADLRFFEGDDQPTHAVTALRDSRGAWQWAETTVGAQFGEHPVSAIDRLGVSGDASPFAEPRSLGFLGVDFVTAQNVRDRKKELDGYVQAIDSDVARCTTLNNETHAAWVSFKAGWDLFMANDPSWWDAGAQGRQAQEYTDQIRAWQAKIAQLCASSVPVLPEPPADQSVGLAKTGLIVAAIIAGALVVRELAK